MTALALAPAAALPQSPTAAAPRVSPSPTTIDAKPRWADLGAAQKDALRPLEREWPNIDAERKQKWLAIAAKFSLMSPEERARVQARMTEWARLSPKERGVARQQFQAAKRVAPQERPALWEAYQALPTEQKRSLAERAAAPSGTAARRAPRAATLERPAQTAPQGKSNIVPNPAHAAPPIPVAAATVQAQPGATTTSMTKRPSPPAHQQTGMPKIAASQGFVDKTTLLPRRGPQGAATRSPAASEPTKRP